MFRNYFSATENQKGSGGNIGIKLASYNRYGNSVANVIGTSTSTASYEDYPGCAGCVMDHLVYQWYPGTRTENGSAIWLPLVLADPFSRASWMRWGNFDVVTGTRFCGGPVDTGWSTTCNSVSEIPTTDAYGFPNQLPNVGDTQVGQPGFPKSFWNPFPRSYNQTPPGVIPEPTIGPDVTGGHAVAPDLFGSPNYSDQFHLAPEGHARMNTMHASTRLLRSRTLTLGQSCG